MALYGSKKTVAVEAVDGGWILDWSDPRLDDEYDSLQGWPRQSRPKTSGREIITTKKALIKRLTDFL